MGNKQPTHITHVDKPYPYDDKANWITFWDTSSEKPVMIPRKNLGQDTKENERMRRNK